MSVFGNLKDEGLEEAQDRLGGFQALETDAYTGTIKVAYAGKANDANSKAQSVTMILDFNGKEYRETFWVADREGKNWFPNRDDKTKKVPLPSYNVVNDICLVTTDKPLADQVAEDKVVNVWDPEAKKELPKTVPMLTGLLGKPVTLGIRKEIGWAQKRNESTGQWEDTDKERTENTTDKVFHYPSGLTVVEAKNNQPATFKDKWVEANKGKTRDRREGKGANSGKAGAPPQSSKAASSNTPSLFDKKE